MCGPVWVSYPSWVNPISSWLIGSFSQLGIKPISSLTSGNLMGWSWIAMEQDPTTQTRSSSEAFFRDALQNTDNVYLYKSTLAKKVLFEHNVAQGVLVDSGGLLYNLNASKEVIVSAGAVSLSIGLNRPETLIASQLRSPQILMVSGIGPREVLESNNISVISDRPGVGQNMWVNTPDKTSRPRMEFLELIDCRRMCWWDLHMLLTW